MLRVMIRVACASLMLIVIASATFASRLAPDDQMAHAGESGSLSELAFLSGTWQGTMGENDFVEEVWTQGKGGGMMGMFRWLNPEGRPRMLELLTINRDGEDVLMRLRHFTAEMVAWEERDAPVVLKMAEAEAGRAVFVNSDDASALARIVFFRSDEDGLGIDVEFTEASGRAALNFRMDRAAP